MKKRLEEIWNDPVVRCPHHQVWWHTGDVEARKQEGEAEGLYWSKGKKYVPPKRDEPNK